MTGIRRQVKGIRDMEQQEQVIVVGAGLAGLNCAHHLAEAGVSVTLLEAADAPGGRVRTETVNGFKLDRGFQVLLTAYPEARAAFDYEALDLHAFFPGAFVRKGGAFHQIADPFRDVAGGSRTLAAPVGSFLDKARIGQLRYNVGRGELEDLWQRPETTSLNYVRNAGFSVAMIEGFLRPFFAGIFLEPDLRTSSRMLEFVFRMFASGDTALPATGIEALPRQLAGHLPDGVLRLNSPVATISSRSVTLDSGETLPARAVVVATDGQAAQELLPELVYPGSYGTACLYYAAPTPPMREPALLLDAEPAGPINNAVVPSNISPLYAPPGAALVSASTVGIPAADDETLDEQARAQMTGWWGEQVAAWELLKIYRIPEALPIQEPPGLSLPRRPVRLGGGRYVCGDHRDNASINGALASSRRAAEAAVADLAGA